MHNKFCIQQGMHTMYMICIVNFTLVKYIFLLESVINPLESVNLLSYAQHRSWALGSRVTT
jgi:hypothetical protein